MDKKSCETNKSAGKSAKVLIPVDFSSKNSLAVKVGFELARRLDREVELIHASVIADPGIVPQFPDDFNGLDNEASEIEEIELQKEVDAMDEKLMAKLKKQISGLQEKGEIPAISFGSVLSPGMPEEVIAEYCALSKPAVIVMATRGCEKRKEELVGSVTAEVIDHAVAPVMTVPEEYTFAGFKSIINICAFCNGDDGDIKAIGSLMEMFDNPEVKIFLFPASDKFKGKSFADLMNPVKEKLMAGYPNAEFSVFGEEVARNLREEAEKFFIRENIQMILAPNRKRSALSRFFHPGLAHKILYEIDFPMLAIPL